jgi:hypothetical protein
VGAYPLVKLILRDKSVAHVSVSSSRTFRSPYPCQSPTPQPCRKQSRYSP